MSKERANISNADTVALYNLLKYDNATPQSIRDVAKACIKNGWQFRAVDQTRGRCYYNIKTITIPLWVLHKQTARARLPGFIYWYVAHELAHVLAGFSAQHGPDFQKTLISICPAQYMLYETSYKPQHASKAIIEAGILPDDL